MMDPVFFMYLGIVVGCGILFWAAYELYRRVATRRKRDASVMYSWVAMKLANNHEDEVEEEREEPEVEFDRHSKGQQNGHYSESKYRLP